MWGQASYKKESFLFTTMFTLVVVFGYMVSYTVIKDFNLPCWPFFVVSTALMLAKSILICIKGKWTMVEIVSEILLLFYSVSFYMPLGLTYLFAEEIGTSNWAIFFNYLIFFPANLVLYFGAFWLNTLYYRFTGKTIDEDTSL